MKIIYDNLFDIKYLLSNLTTSSVLAYRKSGKDCWEELHILVENDLQRIYAKIEETQVFMALPMVQDKQLRIGEEK